MTLGFNRSRRIFCRALYRALNSTILGGAAFIGLFLGLPISAHADNIAKCEIVITETITGESGENNAQIASYRPAADFIASIYNSEKDADIAIIRDIDGYPIRALLCTRKDIIITESDFPLLASAIPFMVSQNFDSPNLRNRFRKFQR